MTDNEILTLVGENGVNRNCKCKYNHPECINFIEEGRMCDALWNCRFTDKHQHRKQCPFYKADEKEYPYVLVDKRKHIPLAFFKDRMDGIEYLNVLTKDYGNIIKTDYQNYQLKEWDGKLWKL